MLGGPKDVWIYETADGKRPIDKWVNGLDHKTVAVIQARLDRIEEDGHLGHAKTLGRGITELIIDKGPGYRIYLAVAARDCLIVLCGGDKSDQARDIIKAKAYLTEYRARQ